VPDELIAWRESGANRGGAPKQFRPSIADTSGFGNREVKQRTEWKGAISSVRNNEGLQLSVGDSIEHDDFGVGKVVAVSGEGPRHTAEINFGAAGKKRLLVKVAPIKKL
jgi:DNA helicase-2/ATP-dependent DNA helicase PcrA